MKKIKVNWIVPGIAVVYPIIVLIFGTDPWTIAKILNTIEWGCITIFAYSFLSKQKSLVSIRKNGKGEKVTIEIITVPFLTYAVQLIAVVTYFWQRAFYMANDEAISKLTATVLLLLIIYIMLEGEGRAWKTRRRQIPTSAN